MTVISTCNELCLLPVNACRPKQDNRTVFKISPMCDHLCVTSFSCIHNHTPDYNHPCCKLVNVAERHVCNNYCPKKGACWFSYQKPIVSSSHVQIIEKLVIVIMVNHQSYIER